VQSTQAGGSAEHNYINLRLPAHDCLLQWDFEKDGHKLKARVEGHWTLNSSLPIQRAVVAERGLAFLPEDMAQKEMANRGLVRVLEDWCRPFPGYHLYYPNRREHSSVLAVVVETLRYRH